MRLTDGIQAELDPLRPLVVQFESQGHLILRSRGRKMFDYGYGHDVFLVVRFFTLRWSVRSLIRAFYTMSQNSARLIIVFLTTVSKINWVLWFLWDTKYFLLNSPILARLHVISRLIRYTVRMHKLGFITQTTLMFCYILCSYRVKRCRRQSCRAFNCRILYGRYLPTVTLIIIGIPSPSHSFIPGFKPSFLRILPIAAFPFLLQDWLQGFRRLFTVTSEHIRFYFLVFMFYTF